MELMKLAAEDMLIIIRTICIFLSAIRIIVYITELITARNFSTELSTVENDIYQE